MLREKFGWPKPDLSPLKNLGTPNEKKLDDEQALCSTRGEMAQFATARARRPPWESDPPRILE